MLLQYHFLDTNIGKVIQEPQDFVMFEYDIWHTEGNLYTTEEIEQMIASSKEDPEQEYLCKYKIGGRDGTRTRKSFLIDNQTCGQLHYASIY